MPNNIFEFCTAEEQAYTLPISVNDWGWSMREHIKTSFFYKHGRLLTGNADDKPVKNIVRPILNLQYRAEDFDVKDIEIYVNDAKNYYKSFLVRKFHEQWARQNNIDTFIDEMVESYVDYGGTLVKNVGVRPMVIPLQSLAFCDQTDILSGPLGIRHYYSPDQLKEMKGWGVMENGADMAIDELLVFAQQYKLDNRQSGVQNKTPGKYIEIYEIHGVLPNKFLEENRDDNYSRQIHIIAYYPNPDGTKHGVTLFKKEVKKPLFKFLKRDPIFGRALGFGGVEELFEPQVWTNYSEIRKKEMLDAASKIILKTTDPAFAARNKVKNMENLEVAILERDTDLGQVDTYPRNLSPFINWEIEMENHARTTGGATDPLLGNSPSAGTPFKLQELVTNEGKSMHEKRKGRLATFLDEIYRDWTIPHIAKEISQGQEFLSDLDLGELQQISETIVTNQVNRKIVEMILNGKLIADSEVEMWKQQAKDTFMLGGNKRFFEIFKDEFKNVPLDVKTNIVGKQKNLSAFTDKLVNVFRQIIINPAVLDDPRMAQIFNQILEASGMSPINFYVKPRPQTVQEMQGGRGVGQGATGVGQGTQGLRQGANMEMSMS